MNAEILNLISAILGVAGSALLAYRVTGILKALAWVAEFHELNLEQLMNNDGRRNIFHFANSPQHIKNAEKRYLLILGFFMIILAALLQLISALFNFETNSGNMSEIWDGVIIGGAGGAIAGITVLLIKYIHTKSVEHIHKKRVLDWLKQNTSDNDGNEFRSTRAIASWCNLTEDRVRYICSIHKNIYLSTGKNDDMWSIYDHKSRSVSS
jgi:hypothetical protein